MVPEVAWHLLGKEKKPMVEHTQVILQNGLSVIEVPMPHMHSVELSAFIRTGSIFERPEESGISHFLEHMLFRGTQKRKTLQELTRAVENCGGTLEAETGRDYTAFHCQFHPNHLAEMMNIYCDIFTQSQFSGVDLERSIILEEYLDSVNEEGELVDLEQLSRCLVYGKNHRLANPILGTRESLEQITRSQLTAHFKSFYGSRNMILTVAGQYSRQTFDREVTQKFSLLPEGQRVQYPTVIISPSAERFTFAHSAASFSVVMVAVPGFGTESREYLPQLLLWKVLDGGMSSKMYSEICSKRGLAYDIEIEFHSTLPTSLFEIVSSSSHENIIKIFEAIREILSSMAMEGISPEDFEFARRRYLFDLEMSQDEVSVMGGWFAGQELYGRAISFAERKAQIEHLTLDDVNRTAALIFRENNLFVTLLGPRNQYASQFSPLKERVSTLPMIN
jgi:predicted Zn-dependent peptidase